MAVECSEGEDETGDATTGPGDPRQSRRYMRHVLRDALEAALGGGRGDSPNGDGPNDGGSDDAITPVMPRTPLAEAIKRGRITATFSAAALADPAVFGNPAVPTAPTACDGFDGLPPLGTGDYEEW